jgi:hypothetical protein
MSRAREESAHLYATGDERGRIGPLSLTSVGECFRSAGVDPTLASAGSHDGLRPAWAGSAARSLGPEPVLLDHPELGVAALRDQHPLP